MPTLPGSSHCAVLWTCWFHGEINDKGFTVFDLTKSQLAVLCCLKERRIADILRELERGGVIITNRDGCNSGGRGLGSERAITGKPFNENHAPQCTPANKETMHSSAS
ncbi:MAG: hypothetical protein AAGD07_10330 [Planctomycetota bacterium]